MKSIAQERGTVPFAPYMAERHYMIPFTQRAGLPSAVRHWQPTVDAMLDGIRTDGKVYLMVDQGLVPAGSALRRPGLHVDGHWLEALYAHRHQEGHRSVPSDRPSREREERDRSHRAPQHMHSPLHYAESVLLASDVTGCEGFVGEYDDAVGPGGEAEHIDVSDMQQVLFHAGRCWAGNVMMLHRSLPMPRPTLRTLVRLNVQGWEPT